MDSRQFKDVVVPAGFRLQDRAHESYSREDASYRQGHFIYSGGMRISDAASYVMQRMPQHSWTMVGDELVDDTDRKLRFERGVYSASYQLSRRDGRTQMVVEYATDYTRR
ncbi:MAG: hypothetical protein AB8H80_03945 [Planctomycetota bacterium]